MIGLALIGRAVTDRLPRRSVMVVSDLVRGLAVAAIAGLTATGHLDILHLILLGGLFGTAEAFFMPAASAIYPDVVPAESLLQANALRSTSTTLSEGLLDPLLAVS